MCFTSSSSHLAAGASFDAAKVIARKNDVSSLSTAASLAGISGEAALAQSLALRCAKDLAAAQDWVTAQEVLSLQESLLVSGKNTVNTEQDFCSTNNIDFYYISYIWEEELNLFVESLASYKHMQPET